MISTDSISHANTKVIQSVWQDAYQAFFAVLQKHSLADLCELRQQYLPIQLIYYI